MSSKFQDLLQLGGHAQDTTQTLQLLSNIHHENELTKGLHQLGSQTQAQAQCRMKSKQQKRESELGKQSDVMSELSIQKWRKRRDERRNHRNSPLHLECRQHESTLKW